MKKLSVIVLAVLMAFGVATSANAFLTFDVDFWADGNPVNNYARGGAGSGDLGGIFDLFPGEFINVDIFFSTDEIINVGGSWDLQYSPSALASVDGTTAAGGPFILPLFSTAPGSVKYQDGVIPGTSVTGDNNFFGSVLFQCQGEGPVDLVLAVDPVIGGFLTTTAVIPFDPVDLGTLSQVPIPGAIWLLGTGLAGLVGLRRTRRK